MQLQPGQQAPDFEVTDVTGLTFMLSDFADQKILLNFNRYAGCPFCSSYFKELLSHAPEYQRKNLQIISFFQSTKEVILHSPGKQAAPFPIVADPDRKIYDLYGVGPSFTGILESVTAIPKFVKIVVDEKIPQGPIDGDFFLMPANFLIGPPHSTIAAANYAKTLTDFMPFEQISDFATS